MEVVEVVQTSVQEILGCWDCSRDESYAVNVVAAQQGQAGRFDDGGVAAVEEKPPEDIGDVVSVGPGGELLSGGGPG
ncbi:hypothetical protein Afe04nite_20460 [Asanoa ferruginea]|nr:hypothetical protein Afe04nite_20460 [Asanoa ferruginea]